MPVSRRFSASTKAGTRMSTQTTAGTRIHTQRVAGNSDSGWKTRNHTRTTAGKPRIRNHSYRSTLADTRADGPCD